MRYTLIGTSSFLIGTSSFLMRKAGFHSELTTGQSQSEHYVVLIVSLHWTVGDSAVKAAFRIRKELVPN